MPIMLILLIIIIIITEATNYQSDEYTKKPLLPCRACKMLTNANAVHVNVRYLNYNVVLAVP